MPHKRAKRAIREQERSKKGSDLAPTRPGAGGDALSSEPLPKAFLRTINAAQVRADFRAKRKLRGEDGEDGEDGQKKGKRRKIDGGRDTQIRPGETLAHFNKRIETDMRPLVRSAVQSSLAAVRAQHKKGSAPSESTPSVKSAPTTNSKSNNAHSKSNPKSSSAADGADSKPAPPPIDKHASRPKEFARTSSAAPRRLNDIAQAPPELSSFARKKSSANAPAGKAGGKSTKASILSPAQQLAMAAAREDAVQRYRALKASRRAAGGADGGERGGGAVGEGEEDE